MRSIICLVLLMSSAALAQPGSGSAPTAGSGSAPAAGSGSGGSGAPASGSAGSAAGGGSGSGNAPAPGPTHIPGPPEPVEPNPAARKACVEAMNADKSFADRIIKTAEVQLHDTLNATQVTKDVCTLAQHTEAQTDVARNKKHVLMAYIAMWLVAAGFVLFLWRRQQSLKLEIANLRRDLDAATKDSK